MDANHVTNIIKNTREGPLTITMEKVDVPTATAVPVGSSGADIPPPGAPGGGKWGTVKYVGSTTSSFALVGCLCFGIPGLCILCCPMDEKDAYLAPNGQVRKRLDENSFFRLDVLVCSF